jgi:YgiT-type zinc finger domain-containing protein
VDPCERCKGQKFASITVEDTIDVSGHTFAAKVPATQCQACGQIVIQGGDLKLFELRVAVELAKAGIRDKEAFKFLRKALSMEHRGLAHILDVPEEFIGYWEGGAWAVDLRAHAVLCGLVLARFDQRPSALDCLGILRQPRTLARTVRVHLVDAMGQAAKALQFGSTAHTTPALA